MPFPTLGNSRADTIRLRFVSGHAFMRAVRVGRFASCRGRRRRGHYGKGTTFSRAVMAALSFCHSEELRFRGICFAAPPDREQGFPRRLPPARDYERRGSIGTSKTRALPEICANVSCGWAAAGGDSRKGTHSCVPLRFEIRFRADQAQPQRLKPSSLPTFRYG